MFVFLGFAALGLCGVGGHFAFRLLSLHLLGERALRTRHLDIEERKVAVLEQTTKSVAVPAAIPSDLYRRITKWENADAQEAERKILLDLYHEFRDASDPWVEVRTHLPPEPRDDLPVEMFTGLLQS